MRYLINKQGYLYPFTEVLAKRNDMRDATNEEVSKFLGWIGKDSKGDEPTDDEVVEWAKKNGIDNNKTAIAEYGLEKFQVKISKQLSTVNMVRELIKLSNDS